MNSMKDIIQDCHQRREKTFRQRKTIVTPALHKGYPYHFRVHCAHGCPVRLYDLEQANISFMPIGHAPQYDHAPKDFGGERLLKRQRTRDWIPRRWYASWGIQVYTGRPSEHDSAQWHDIDFKYDAICAAPDAVSACIASLVNAVANPLLTLTKSGGLRFSCRIPDYLHPNAEETQQYIYKHTPIRENPHHRDVYLEILGDAGYSPWDARHEILLGDLLDPPVITKDVLFSPLDTLRDALHEPAPPLEENLETTSQPITIASPVPDPVNEKVVAVRQGKLSPLAIKRPSPVLRKSEHEDALPATPALWVPEHDEKTGWLCAVDETGEHALFCEISAPKDVLVAWSVNWQEKALGNFAKALLNALESKSKLYENPVGRVRIVMLAFQGQAETLIQQMREKELNSDPHWTFWHQLTHFFQHYQRDADAPMVSDDGMLRFWVPSMLDEAFPDSVIDVNRTEPSPWLTGNRVFQIRTGIYSVHELLNYENSWDDLGPSKIGQRFLDGIGAEIERDPSVSHAIISNQRLANQLGDVAGKANVHCLEHIKNSTNVEAVGVELEQADVMWIVGVPYAPPHLAWQQAQILFGDDAESLCYDLEINPYHHKDERIQRLCEQNIVGILTQIIRHAGLDRSSNKTLVLLTGMRLSDITDRPETLLFDWEDFEIAGSLDKLSETIATRQHFETERVNLTAASGREKVEHVLGISSSQANRVLMKLRGGKLRQTSLQDQILTFLSDGEKKTAELVTAVAGHPNAIKNELKRLVASGDIVKVRRSVYTLPLSAENQRG